MKGYHACDATSKDLTGWTPEEGGFTKWDGNDFPDLGDGC